jgi:hypothetical protein
VRRQDRLGGLLHEYELARDDWVYAPHQVTVLFSRPTSTVVVGLARSLTPGARIDLPQNRKKIDRGALQSLGEFALTAPASKVREHYRLLVDASADLGQGRTHEHLERVLKLLRQRAGITESPPGLLSSKSMSVGAGASKR